ncbi:MAG: dual specificity protein phosphatase family protein [Alistipes sp.]|nr:dual specificity protein phosphatase family protein [Alistipes sp.]
MKIYKFSKISARCFPTIADINNPWIFQEDIGLVINVSQHTNDDIANILKLKGIKYLHFPLEEEVNDIGWENIKQAIVELLQFDKTGNRIIVHCDFGQHRSRLVIEAFYFAKFGEHFSDEYKGCFNHLIYNCTNNHLPNLDVVENTLLSLSIKQ